jgi:hypothetical protein
MKDQFKELKRIESALKKYLFKSRNADESLTVLLQNPQLLTNFVDNLLDSLIEEAKKEQDSELAKYYLARQMLLQVVRNSLSKKELALLTAIKQTVDRKNNIAKHLASVMDNEEPFDLTEILNKVLKWLEASTQDNGINVLEEFPDLLTDKTEKMFAFMIDEAHQHGNTFFEQILRSLSQFFRILRLELGEKNVELSRNELGEAIEYALENTDFSIFRKGKQSVIFIA